MTVPMLKLETRAVLRLAGPEARPFLQGLVTNDVMKAGPEKAVYAAMLTPQGKFLFDMIIMADGDDLLLDIETARKTDLMRRLMMYKLRADVTIEEEPGLNVWAAFEKPEIAGLSCTDPRHPGMGWRTITTATPDDTSLPVETYETKRLTLGVPDGSRDMVPEKYFWLETAAERLNGVSFTKGCYVGQELTARMKHRTNLKKMLVPVSVSDGAVQSGAIITTHDGKNAGEIRSAHNDLALAYFRLEFENARLVCDGKAISLQQA